MPAATLTPERHLLPDDTVAAGIILLVVTLLEILAMAHHPTVGTADVGTAVQRIGEFSRLSGLVHGVLIAVLLLTFHGLTTFAQQLGFVRPLVRSGVIAYGSGTIVMIGAALVSGFVIGDVTTLGPHDTAVDLQIDHHVLILCRILNQACADFAVVAMSVGIVLWSVELLRIHGSARWIGVLGCVVGIVPVVRLLSGSIRLDVHGMSTVVLVQAVWTVAIAAWLLRLPRNRAPLAGREA
jgi:hypothetical protein